MANILLVATGGTQAPTQIELYERFRADGHAVRLLASGSALRFISAYLARRPKKIIDYLRSYRPAFLETLAYYRERPTSVPHISEVQWADIAVMAPATCNSISKLASGISDSYALLVLRAFPRNKRIIVVPSMNPEMWFDPFLQRNIDLLNETEKYRVLSPVRGQMLCGDWGFGAQVPIGDIVAETYRLLGDCEESARIGVDSLPTVRFLHIDPDSELRASLATAVRSAYPQVEVFEFGNPGQALDWMRSNQASGILTELDFTEGPTGIDLIDQLCRTGSSDLQIIATSTRKRGVVRAEQLGQLDIHFVPKPLNLSFIVGLIAGTLQLNARHQSSPGVRQLEQGDRDAPGLGLSWTRLWRKREGVPAEDAKKAQATMWGMGGYERIADTLAPMHDALVRHMDPQPDECWLDIATGTGAVALHMARLGAQVTGVDLSPVLIARARIAAARAGFPVQFDVGDAERLDYPDAGFDGVVSAVGAIFASDHCAVARELARSCRPGGKIGLTAWRPDGGVGDFFEVSAQFREPRPKHDAAFDWGRDSYVEKLLGHAFELEVFDYDAPFVVPSSAAAWEILSTSYGPTMMLAGSLDEAQRDSFRRAVIAFYDRFWTGSEVRHHRRYALYVGTRRAP